MDSTQRQQAMDDAADTMQQWRDEVMAEYTRLVAKRGTDEPDALVDPDEQTIDLLNEAIRDSIDIGYLWSHYGAELGI